MLFYIHFLICYNGCDDNDSINDDDIENTNYNLASIHAVPINVKNSIHDARWKFLGLFRKGDCKKVFPCRIMSHLSYSYETCRQLYLI